ncbi:MAG TPA: ATP-binding protein, partial [Polyangiaceae bacterium]|nr:ATP-binding protein [Polyangiaceae bacterium]
GNAIKFTREGSVTLRVEAQVDERGVGSPAFAPDPEQKAGDFVFRVEDTGPGIAPADLARIFDPFEQARVRGERPEGTGLGLSICRKIVDQMGGRIDVESAVGEGSAFTVALRLPILADKSPASDARPAEAMKPPPDVLARLLDLAERGRIPELVREVGELEEKDARLEAWAGEVRALAGAYRLRELCEELASGEPSADKGAPPVPRAFE